MKIVKSVRGWEARPCLNMIFGALCSRLLWFEGTNSQAKLLNHVTSPGQKSMEHSQSSENRNEMQAPVWKPLSRDQRRVLGTLIEKSKTTPDVYPMTINGIKTGSNQKSNRSPILELDESKVEDVLYELRQLGCVIEVHSGGRVPKFKHQAYDWLGVSKPELSVLAELLLRGEQSVGELRSRVARMEAAIESLEDLRPVLSSLKQKNLLVELTPATRGQVVTHNLYQASEITRLRDQFKDFGHSAEIEPEDHGQPLSQNPVEHNQVKLTPPHPAPAVSNSTAKDMNEAWEKRIINLEEQIAKMQSELTRLKNLIES